jgi:hypothetical protein
MQIRHLATALLATALLGGCVTGYQPYRSGVGGDYYGRPSSGYGYGAPYGSVGYGYPGGWSGSIGYGAGYGYGLPYGYGFGPGFYGYPYYGYGFPYYAGYYPSYYHPRYPRTPPVPQTRPNDPRPGYTLPDNGVRYPSRAQQALRQPPQPKAADMVDGNFGGGRVETPRYPSRYQQLQPRPDAVTPGGGQLRSGAGMPPPPPRLERQAPTRSEPMRSSMPVERAPVRSSGRGMIDETPR